MKIVTCYLIGSKDKAYIYAYTESYSSCIILTKNPGIEPINIGNLNCYLTLETVKIHLLELNNLLLTKYKCYDARYNDLKISKLYLYKVTSMTKIDIDLLDECLGCKL